MYRFKTNYSCNGTTYYAGVCFKGPYIINNDKVSGMCVKNVPLEFVEEFEEPKKVRRKRAKKQKTQNLDNSKISVSRVSKNLEALRKD
jgi:hypothetical protein